MAEAHLVHDTPLWRESIESVLDADRFDLEDWRVAVESLPQLSRDDQRASEEFCGHPVQDGFLSLFKSAPPLFAITLEIDNQKEVRLRFEGFTDVVLKELGAGGKEMTIESATQTPQSVPKKKRSGPQRRQCSRSTISAGCI